ncbi:hypothetical protein FI667_g13677, partial [Globisporangium splendens]
MGNVASWLAECIYPEEQVLWQAARSGDAHTLRTAIAKLTSETRKYMEWQEPCSGRAALAEAALRGHRECVELLVGAGANCNAKDYRGNTPLHLACKRGKDDVVQYLLQVPNVFPFETNLDTLTPLDLVRKKISKDESHPLSFERCLEELEKKFCVYSGWLYEERDNVLSMVSGISSLGSWKRRFCIVLERGAPDILELALFSMKPCGIRPVCPSSVILYQVGAGMAETTDTKWFNRKDFAFSIRGNRKENCHYDSTIVMEPLQFAAVDQAGYDAWKCFFDHQRQSLHTRATNLYGQPVVMLNPPPHALQQGQRTASVVALPTAEQYQIPPTQAAVTYDRSESKPAAAAPLSNYPAFTTATTQEQEEADLRRAIWLSLQTTGNHPSDPLEPATSPALPVSAPDWDEGDDSASLPSPSSHSASEHDNASSPAAAPASPVVNFGRAPSYSSIGECIVCFDGPQAAVCVPCGHNAVCMSCAEEILETSCECPVCRTPIRELIKLYRV